MRSRPDLRLCALLALLAAAPALPAARAAEPPTNAEIERAIAQTKADPELATEKKATRLVWDGDRNPRERDRLHTPGWLKWLGSLFSWIAQGSGLLVWVLLACLAALSGVFLVRLFAAGGLPERNRRFIAPTHVQDLDIRPESLPADIGAAARALWDGGAQRAALALLYRGLLSRLAHTYEVPIRDSSTEGDCLVLAARTLDAARVAYASQLVRTWQRAIYGGLSIDTAQVWDLCANFATHLDGPAQGAARGHEPVSHGAPA
ncbi:MAG: DUF4129 domain-containing protein [Pseudomonadota bacterium]